MSNIENIEYYALSMIDILGQKQELIKLNQLKLSDNKSEINELF
jgi:hypothetical protein